MHQVTKSSNFQAPHSICTHGGEESGLKFTSLFDDLFVRLDYLKLANWYVSNWNWLWKRGSIAIVKRERERGKMFAIDPLCKHISFGCNSNQMAIVVHLKTNESLLNKPWCGFHRALINRLNSKIHWIRWFDQNWFAYRYFAYASKSTSGCSTLTVSQTICATWNDNTFPLGVFRLFFRCCYM